MAAGRDGTRCGQPAVRRGPGRAPAAGGDAGAAGWHRPGPAGPVRANTARGDRGGDASAKSGQLQTICCESSGCTCLLCSSLAVALRFPGASCLALG